MDTTWTALDSGVTEIVEPHCARTLGAITDHAALDGAVRKNELRWGDQVMVRTRNSLYCLEAMGDDTFVVTGGWFDRNAGPRLVTVNGCTYGGRAIRQDVVAALGLFLEFGNSVTTTRIQKVRVLRRCDPRLRGAVRQGCFGQAADRGHADSAQGHRVARDR